MPKDRRPSRVRRALPVLAALALILGLAGCYWRIAREPMPFITYGALGPEHARGAIVLLPGLGGAPQDFEEYGFVAVLKQEAPGYDLIAADAHVGYYSRNTLLDQLHASVIGPLLARGYRELWIVGVSMGGHGAIAYARTYPQRLKGVLLFAPYLGPGDVLQAVAQSGGICRYAPPVPLAQDRVGFAQANFLWLKATLCTGPAPVPVWLAVGDRDQDGRTLLRDVLAPDHHVVLPGGHDWDVWTPALALIARAAFAAPAPVR
jgi:pimeloyl-ACP methyl ester carboxylesterase